LITRLEPDRFSPKNGGKEMKKHMRLGLLVMALVATLLATGSVAAGPEGTPFDAILHICSQEGGREWWTHDTIQHIRNADIYAILISTEERMNGPVFWKGHQDLDTSTGNGRSWGMGVIKTAVGTWHVSFDTTIASGVMSVDGVGHGRDGLQAQVVYYHGVPRGPVWSEPCGAEVLVVDWEGYILEH
jgi:hypothetical protein